MGIADLASKVIGDKRRRRAYKARVRERQRLVTAVERASGEDRGASR
ncbi:hypothetical protein [Saccharothrix xinjiangensis]